MNGFHVRQMSVLVQNVGQFTGIEKKMNKKICPKCKVIKPFYEFSKDRIHKDGLFRICKKCDSLKHKQYHQKNKEKLNKKTQKWLKKHTEYNKQYYLKNIQYYFILLIFKF